MGRNSGMPGSLAVLVVVYKKLVAVFIAREHSRCTAEAHPVGPHYGPASSINTRMPFSVSIFATQPPLAPEPTMIASYVGRFME